VLDLTKLPPIGNFYTQPRYDRDRLIFLNEFVKSIAEPVVHDGREHIDYVPTQILTEYFRHRYRLHDKAQLDGIIYPSAQHKKSRAIVIFASPDDMNPKDAFGLDRTPLLRMDTGSIKRLRKRKH